MSRVQKAGLLLATIVWIIINRTQEDSWELEQIRIKVKAKVLMRKNLWTVVTFRSKFIDSAHAYHKYPCFLVFGVICDFLHSIFNRWTFKMNVKRASFSRKLRELSKVWFNGWIDLLALHWNKIMKIYIHNKDFLNFRYWRWATSHNYIQQTTTVLLILFSVISTHGIWWNSTIKL